MSSLVETMAYAGETPWHGLGNAVSNDLTVEEMQEVSGTLWTVDKIPQFIEYKGERIQSPDYALVRSTDKKILTTISDGWEPVQNHEAFAFFREWVISGKMKMHTAGSLKGGQLVWVLAEVGTEFTILKGKDLIKAYFLFTLPHQYGKGIDLRFTNIRTVCWNTVSLALRGKNDHCLKLDHTKKFDPNAAKAALGLSEIQLNSYKEMAEFLATKKYTKESELEFFRRVFPKTVSKVANDEGEDAGLSRIGSFAMAQVDTQPGANLGAGTFWQLFNAATFFVDHLAGHSPDTRLTSAWYGPNRDRKNVALKTAVELANAA